MRRLMNEAGLWLIGIPVFLWTVLPLYHMMLFALSTKDSAFSGKLWPQPATVALGAHLLTLEPGFAFTSGTPTPILTKAFARYAAIVAIPIAPLTPTTDARTRRPAWSAPPAEVDRIHPQMKSPPRSAAEICRVTLLQVTTTSDFAAPVSVCRAPQRRTALNTPLTSRISARTRCN
jgi:hypothetical protein